MKRLNLIFVLMLAVFALFIACKSGGGEPDDEDDYVYTVTFNKNGGDTEASPATMTVTSPATNVGALPTAPVKAGYAFVGWNTKADGSGSAFTASTTVTADITVYAKWEEAAEGDFHIVLENTGEETGDAVTRSPARADAGATITITYTLANTKLNNRLTFSGTTETIEEVDEPGTGTRAYTVNEDDADVDGIIRILATFIHTDKTIDTIAFENPVVTVKYGETPTAITVSNTGEGSGTITYSSSNTGIATVDNNGQVTLVDVGSTTITATKAEDATYAEATASYTLHIGKGDGATLTGTLTAAANGISEDSIEVVAITPPSNGQTIEYAISTTNSEPADGWHHSTTFTELTASTTYYVFARAAGNDHYEAGTAISGTFSTTASVALKISYDFTTNPGDIWNTTTFEAVTGFPITTAWNSANTALEVTLTTRGTGNNTGPLILVFQLGTTKLSDYQSIVVNIAAGNSDGTNKNSFAAEVAPASGTFGGIGQTATNTRLGTTTGGGLAGFTGSTGTFNSRTISLSTLTAAAGTPGALTGEVKIAFGIAEYVNANTKWLIKSATLVPKTP
jgi:uncharacterized repeat protein (TIGR02543 family)